MGSRVTEADGWQAGRGEHLVWVALLSVAWVLPGPTAAWWVTWVTRGIAARGERATERAFARGEISAQRRAEQQRAARCLRARAMHTAGVLRRR